MPAHDGAGGRRQGTVVTAGRARCVVVGTGPHTAIGKIHHAMASQEEELSPLKKKLDEFGNFLSKAIAVICVLVWVINIRCGPSSSCHASLPPSEIYSAKYHESFKSTLH